MDALKIDKIDFELKEDVIFYKFNTNSKTAQEMIDKYPPNEKQRLICHKLNVPYLLWSFYKAVILKHELFNLSDKLYPVEFRKIKIPVNLNFENMNLDPEEKMFISYHKELNEIRENSVCIQNIPSRLSELCMKTIILQINFCELKEEKWKALLPKALYQRLVFYQKYMIQKGRKRGPPEWKNEKVQLFDTDSLINFFKEKDKPFSKDFTAWFLNDDTLCFEKFSNSHKLITFQFSVLYDSLDWCLECLKESLRGYRVPRYLGRDYEIRDVTLLNAAANRLCYWCNYCSRVPLFQILSVQDISKQYGSKLVEYYDELGLKKICIKSEYII